MQHTCNIHCDIQYMQHTCNIHATQCHAVHANIHCNIHTKYLPHICNLHARYMQHTCNIHCTIQYMQHTCNMHATNIQHIWSIFATYMQHTCNIHCNIQYTQHTYNIHTVHATYIQHTCSTCNIHVNTWCTYIYHLMARASWFITIGDPFIVRTNCFIIYMFTCLLQTMYHKRYYIYVYLSSTNYVS